MVMLVDTAAGGVWNQKCTISRNEGILIPIWTGECDQGAKGMKVLRSRNYQIVQEVLI